MTQGVASVADLPAVPKCGSKASSSFGRSLFSVMDSALPLISRGVGFGGVHSAYIKIFLEAGIIGAFLIIGAVVIEAYRRMRIAVRLGSLQPHDLPGINIADSLRLNVIACSYDVPRSYDVGLRPILHQPRFAYFRHVLSHVDRTYVCYDRGENSPLARLSSDVVVPE